MKGRGRRGHTSALGRRWACPESARDDYARVISDRKWPLKKRPVIAHIKARSKHSCLTINRNDLLYTNYTLEKKNREEEIHGGSGSTWGEFFYMGTQNGLKLEI